MKHKLFSLFLVVAALALAATHLDAAERTTQAAVVEKDVMVPMRDGVRLATDIVRPRKEGRFPVILSRTPYGKRTPGPGAVANGYALVTQDVRGRYNSEGEFRAFVNEPNDGYDTIEWLAAQPWCDGNVGMVGGSYVGFTQVAAAMARPPHLRCIMPEQPLADLDGRSLFFGGALRADVTRHWLFAESWNSQRVLRNQVAADEMERSQPHREYEKWCWRLPLAEPGPIALGGPSYVRSWQEAVSHWEDPHFWESVSAAAHPERIVTPALVVGGFYDAFGQENIELFLALRARGGSEASRRHSHLLMGPWVHGVGKPSGDADFPAAHGMLTGLQERWNARWLKDRKTNVDKWPPIRFFVMGANKWADSDTWPPKGTVPKKFYFTGKTLSPNLPPAGEPPSVFTYDPANPVPTLAGNALTRAKKRGVTDHRANAARSDVVHFISEPLAADLTVAGRLRAHLFVSSSAPDTDFTVMLLDVRPDGYMANVQDGIVRARYRHGRDKPALLRPNEVIEVDVDLWSTACMFKTGHRVAVHVSSSNFPRFDRNLNTADPSGRGETFRSAENKVFHDAARASYIELPVGDL